MRIAKWMGLILGCLMAVNAMAEDVVVKVRPPHAIVETRGQPPAKNYVWLPGYHRWDGRGYVWAPGRWEVPPRPKAHWVPAKWVKRHDGWVLEEGHWR